MKIFITGGCKNGKTSFAQELAVKLSGDCPRYYIATMVPVDDEDRKRIGNHIRDREGQGFITKEISEDIAQVKDLEGTLLIDSVTALLANEMFSNRCPQRRKVQIMSYSSRTSSSPTRIFTMNTRRNTADYWQKSATCLRKNATR